MAYELRFAPEAEADIADILWYSQSRFGEEIRRGYEEAIGAAIRLILKNPECPGSHDRSDLAVGIRLFHLHSGRELASKHARKVLRPRPFLVYRVVGRQIQIVRLLHEAMDLSARNLD